MSYYSEYDICYNFLRNAYNQYNSCSKSIHWQNCSLYSLTIAYDNGGLTCDGYVI